MTTYKASATGYQNPFKSKTDFIVWYHLGNILCFILNKVSQIIKANKIETTIDKKIFENLFTKPDFSIIEQIVKSISQFF